MASSFVSSSPSNQSLSSNSPAGGTTRVPGTYQPEWLPDQDANSCMFCDTPFTLIKRRHHCRSCGKIFCADCCNQRAKLLFLDNKEARVCRNCFNLLESTIYNLDPDDSRIDSPGVNHPVSRPSSSSGINVTTSPNSGRTPKVQSVLKTGNHLRANVNECNTPSSSSSEQHQNKQVIFADGIRPGTDLSETSSHPIPSASSSSDTSNPQFPVLARQSKISSVSNEQKSQRSTSKNITVCDQLGYLPPIVVSGNSAIANLNENVASGSSSSIASLIVSQIKLTGAKKSIHASMESRSSPLNGIMQFNEIADLVGDDGAITFLLLKDFYLRAKLVSKLCCIDNRNDYKPKNDTIQEESESADQIFASVEPEESTKKYWCFSSDGLANFGQNEVLLLVDKDSEESCIPRDIFKIYLTLHELSLRRQSIENLGNLLFQDGLFGNRDVAGLIFVRPLETHCLTNLVLPTNPFLIALILQRWEVPWSKVFPIRLLLRLGHRFNFYPYPILSVRNRDPVYYEVGHTIISILGDFRNFRYSITHVDGLIVSINKSTRTVKVKLDEDSYQQFNKVLDSSSNEHVLAWSSCPFPEADGHLVSVQDDEGHHETVEFYNKTAAPNLSFEGLSSSTTLGASFIIFSGALKVEQGGQSAKISIVEDGLLIQIQSCTMSALKSSIQYMHNFEIDCESQTDTLNRVEIEWQLKNS